MRSGPRVVAWFLALTLVSLAVGTPVVAAQSGADGERPRCFPTGGHEVQVGSDDPGISMTVHTSLFTNVTGGGAFGLTATGTALNSTIVSLQTGVVFDGVGDAGDFLGDPFDAFAVVFDYRFSLPMFADRAPGDSTYESTDSPVSGVNSTDC
jgi:hypothetical protein